MLVYLLFNCNFFCATLIFVMVFMLLNATYILVIFHNPSPVRTNTAEVGVVIQMGIQVIVIRWGMVQVWGAKEQTLGWWWRWGDGRGLYGANFRKRGGGRSTKKFYNLKKCWFENRIGRNHALQKFRITHLINAEILAKFSTTRNKIKWKEFILYSEVFILRFPCFDECDVVSESEKYNLSLTG